MRSRTIRLRPLAAAVAVLTVAGLAANATFAGSPVATDESAGSSATFSGGSPVVVNDTAASTARYIVRFVEEPVAVHFAAQDGASIASGGVYKPGKNGRAHLDVTNPTVRFTNSTLNLVFTSPPGPGGSATTMTVTVPDDPLNFPAGVFTLAVLFTRDDGASAETNEFPFSVAPRIDDITPKLAPVGNVTYTVQCSPAVQPQQHASLLLGSIETPLPLQSPNAPATQQLVFDVPNLTAGDYFVRLRVDGIDSLLVNQSTTPPTFDQSQKVTIQ